MRRAAADDEVSFGVANHLILRNEHVAILVAVIVKQVAAYNTLLKRLNGLVTGFDLEHFQTLGRTAVILTNDNILRNVNQTSGQITGVSRSQSRISKTLTSTTGGNEVFQNVQAFTVVRLDRNFDRLTGRIRDQTAHAGQLTDLVHRTTGAGVCHHEDRVVTVKAVLQGFRNVVRRLFPGLQNRAVTLAVGEEAVAEICGNLADLCLCLCKNLLLLRRNRRIADSNGDCADGGILVALCLNGIEHFACDRRAVLFDALVDDLAELLLTDEEIDLKLEDVLRVGAVNKAKILRDRAVEDHAAHRRIDKARICLAVVLHGSSDLDLGVQRDIFCVIRHERFVHVAEYLAFTDLSVLIERKVIRTENHILRRDRNRAAVGRL